MLVAAVLVPGLRWPAPIETYGTAKGEQQSLTLPDGSQAVLDTLLRARISSTTRTVYLDRGQAYFTAPARKLTEPEVEALVLYLLSLSGEAKTVNAVPAGMAGVLAMMTSRFMVGTAVAASPCSGPRRSSHAS